MRARAFTLASLVLSLSLTTFGNEQMAGAKVLTSSPAPARTASVDQASGAGSGSALEGDPIPGPGETTMEGRTRPREKTVANGLYMSGSFTYLLNFTTSLATVTLTRIDNATSGTTGTLKLELWASVAKPARAGSFSGYRMGSSSLLNPMPPFTFYSDLSETRPFTRPPDGTYWIVLVLLEYNPAACTSSDGYCQQDSFVSFSQQTFGNAPPPPPPPPTLGVLTSTLGARGGVTQATALYGGFVLVNSSKVLILVRGNSLGTLRITQSYLDAPRVRLYNAQGADLVSQGGVSGFNFCLASNTTTDYPVVAFYQARGQPPDSRDSCYVTTLPAGAYTFSVTPSFMGSTSHSTNSANPFGEVLFEVSLARP